MEPRASYFAGPSDREHPLPLYVDCATSGNVFADVCVTTVGDLIRLVGYSKVDFDVKNAVKLALDILERCRRLGWEDPDTDDGK